MNRLTGLQRFQLTRIWRQKHKDEMALEEYIKEVCKAKGLVYTEPVKVKR